MSGRLLRTLAPKTGEKLRQAPRRPQTRNGAGPECRAEYDELTAMTVRRFERFAPLAIDHQAGACGVRASCLGALTKRPRDGVGSGLYAELGFQAREPVSDCVQAEAQLPGDVLLFHDRGGGTEHLRLARSQA